VDDLQYHTDSITTLIPSGLGGKNRNGSAMLTAGRDGNICEVDCLSREYTKIYANKQPVTCLCVDNDNGYIWYGTPSSTINCFKAPETNRRQQWGDDFARDNEK